MNELQLHLVYQLYNDSDELITILEEALAYDRDNSSTRVKISVALEKTKNLTNLLFILKASGNGIPKDGPFR